MSRQLRDGITEYITNRLYARPLLRDAWRETYAEALVYAALQDNAPQSGWRPAAAGQPWDLENDDRIQLQVKQTAALQPGSNGKNRGRPQSLSFDIHPGETGRQTHIYIFAWHPESDPEHRRPPRRQSMALLRIARRRTPGTGSGAKNPTHFPAPDKVPGSGRRTEAGRIQRAGRNHNPHRGGYIGSRLGRCPSNRRRTGKNPQRRGAGLFVCGGTGLSWLGLLNTTARPGPNCGGLTAKHPAALPNIWTKSLHPSKSATPGQGINRQIGRTLAIPGRRLPRHLPDSRRRLAYPSGTGW